MKKVFFGFLVCLVVICVLAWTPTDRMFNLNQFGTNNFSISVKSGALMTNTTFYGSPAAFGTENFKFRENAGNFDMQDSSLQTLFSWNAGAETWNFGFPVVVSGNVSSPSGIFYGNGSGLSNVIGAVGSGPFTNLVEYGTQTNFATTANGNGGNYIKLMTTWHSNSTYAAPFTFYQGWTYQTDFNHDHPDVVTTFGYNLASGGIVNANEPTLGYVFENRWQNFDDFEQSEWYMYYATPTNGYGTNYDIRFLSFTPQYKIGTDNQTFTSSDLSVESTTFSVKPPKWTGTAPLVVNNTPGEEAASLSLAGYLITRTNTENYGGVSILGGEVDYTVPTGFAASHVANRIDYDNAVGFRPHFYSLFSGTPKSWIVSGATNWSANETTFFIHGANSRLQATNIHAANFTNTSITSAIPWHDANGKQNELTVGSGLSLSVGGTLTATGGSGDTNGISYLTTLIKAAGVRTLANGTPVFEITYTNGFQAVGVTNNGSDTDSFAIRDSTGLNVFNFVTGADTFLRSPAHFYGFVNTSIPFIEAGLNTRRLFDTNGNIIIEFEDATTGVNITTLNPTTVNTAAINLGENSGAIALDAALSADGKSSGITRAGTAGATLAFGDLVVLDVTDSRWELADANSASGADGDARGMIGVCVLAAAADGDPTVILLQGVVRADAAFPSFTVNAPVYVSETAGDITATSPTTSGNVVRILGAATTADEIYFDPDRVWTIYVP